MDTLSVALGERGYSVHVGRGLLARIAEWAGPPCRAGVLRDDGVPFSLLDRAERTLLAAGFSLATVTVRAGESQKSLSEAERILDALVAGGLDRHSPLFVVGGGMLCDLGGFCASVLLRGVDTILIPTTLLAQLDAAIGGKTAVNLESGKNLCGTFWQPRVVLCDLDALGTLPLRELRSGLAEAVKCGLIGDGALLELLEGHAAAAAAGDLAILERVVVGAARIKAGIVSRDEREAGERVHLNLGHTVGHALEMASAFDLRHGEAVSLGLVAAMRLGVRLGVTPPDLSDRILRLLSAIGLPTDLDRYLETDWLVPAVFDKKRSGGVLPFICVSGPGLVRVVKLNPSDLLANLRY